MSEDRAAERVERILVAMDASPHSVAALQAAAELAAWMQAEVHGIFVEDINLLHLCGLPFSCEVGSFTASVRQLDNRSLERHFRSVAHQLRRAMETTAGRAHVRWSFEVARGGVANELLAAAEAATLLSLGRAGRRRVKSLGSTARLVVSRTSRPVLVLGEDGHLRFPLIVLYTGTAAADRGLQLATRMAARTAKSIFLLLMPDTAAGQSVDEVRRRAAVLLASTPVQGERTVVEDQQLRQLLASTAEGTFILPGEYAHLLTEITLPAVLVP